MKYTKQYGHLTQYERDRLEAMLLGGHKQSEIAEVLKRDKGTISKEIARNRRKIRKKKGTVNGKYEATVAGNKAYLRRYYSKYQGKKINEDDKLRGYILRKLEKHWSPDEISGRMKKDKELFYASKNAIYEWLYSVWGQKYCKYLCQKRYNPKKRKKKKAKKQLIPNRIGIEMRPDIINKQLEYGHYEGDTIVSGRKTGSKEALAVVYERKAKYINVKKIKSLKPILFNSAINQFRANQKISSLTLDNGIENVKYEKLNIPTYYCDPYSSWQKGGVENCNKMIRRFIPKGCDISNYSDEYVRMVVEILNNKPRKSLNYQTPTEVMIVNDMLIGLKNKKTATEKVALRG